jgi:sensor domain CHASE-containing protein
MLYNGMLRGGRGFCGEVPFFQDVEFGSDEFWQLLRATTVADRMKNAGHKFSSTMHVLASAIKKIQGIAEDGQGTRLYRGLGTLMTQLFTKPLLIFNHL